MEKRKISLITLVFVIIIVLAIGIGVGYLITINMKNGQMVKETSIADNKTQTQVEKVIENKNENIENITVGKDNTSTTVISSKDAETPVAQTQYDGSQNITINNANYKISYLSEKHTMESGAIRTEIKLYFNDKKIKTLNMGWIDNVNHIYGEKDYKVELYELCKDYILIAVKAQKDDGETYRVNRVQFCIINSEGEHIDTLKWDDATYIKIKDSNKQLTYEINKDYISIQEYNVTMKYFVTRDYLDSEIIKVYNENELTMAGK